MSDWTLYDLSTGVIVGFKDGSTPSTSLLAERGMAAVIGEYSAATHYVDVIGGVAVPKVPLPYAVDKTSILANDIDAATFSGLPAGTMLWVMGKSDTEASGEIPFTVDYPGIYTLTLRHPHYLDVTEEITAS